MYEWFLAVGITLLLASAAYLCLFLDKRRSYWRDKNFPCTERPVLLFGDYKGANQTEHMQYVNQRLYRQFKARRLPIGGTLLFVVPTAIVVDPELIKAILVKDFDIFHSRGVYSNPEVDPLTGHLFSLDGNAWRKLRTKLSPTFTSGKLKMMFGTLLTVAEDLRCLVQERLDAGEHELDMKNILAGYSTDVIGSCAFGIECNSMRSAHCEIREVAKKIFDNSMWRMMWMVFLMTCKPVATWLRLKSVPDDVEKFFTELVQGTIKQRQLSGVQRHDFVNLLMQLQASPNAEERITMDEITAQAFIFLVAGFETSATTLINCLYELAMNEGVQDRLRSEINKACGDQPLTYETIFSIEYLGMVIDETLRKYPPSDILIRKSYKPYNIPDTELRLPEGTLILIPMYAIHHDPEYYPDPERFDPERFSAPNRAKRHPFVYLPFGEGPRNCIGMRFAFMEIRVGLIKLLRDFRVNPCPSTPVPLEVEVSGGLATPRGEVRLRLERI